MTSILIIGGGGMVGQKLGHALATAPLSDATDSVTLFDLGFPEKGAPASTRVTGNVTDDAQMTSLISARPEVIFHLASIVSGEAETDFDLGWTVNGRAFWNFLETVRAVHLASKGTYRPRVIFTSSIAVFGALWPCLHAVFHIWIWVTMRGMPFDQIAAVNLFGIQMPAWLALMAALKTKPKH